MEAGGEIALVATKLTSPALPRELVERDRLGAALDAAVVDPNIRVVLVSAPAGSGKSTLVASWQRFRNDSAWLQIDVADRDAARFWAHVGAALSHVVPDLDNALDPYVSLSSLDPEPLIDQLVNELADTPPVVLVIDDYHLIANPAIDQGIERLIELAPQTLTIVLLTRWDPAIRLSRLRVSGQLHEVRAAALRFSEHEAADLLRTTRTDGSASGSPLDEAAQEQARLLCDRTEGWAAGLVLARLSLAAVDDKVAFLEAFRGDDRLVVDYLSDEFLTNTDAEDERRLLATSVLEELSGPLIDAVCDTTDGTTWLADLAARNQLVIGLGRSNTWYRYHHLLRDVLRLKAGGGQPIEELHRRAGAWHRSHGDLDRAAEHLLEGGDLRVAADVVADHSMDLLNRGQINTVSGYLRRLGPVVDDHLRCGVIAGWIHAVLGRLDDAQHALERLRALDAANDTFTLGLIEGLDVMIRLGRGDVAGAIEVASDTPTITEASQSLVVAQAFVWGGRFDDANPLLHRAGQLANDNEDRFAMSGVPSVSAVVAIESGDSFAAHRFATQTVAVIAERGALSGGHGALAHTIIARTTDDAEQAITSAGLGAELARAATIPVMAAYALASAADVLCAHEVDGGPELLAEARHLVDRCSDPGIAGRYLTRVESRHRLSGPTTDPSDSRIVEPLTDRELAVLRYLPTPLSQRDIASELYVSLNTVKTHCKAIYRKLAVGDRKAAVQAARDAGLL